MEARQSARRVEDGGRPPLNPAWENLSGWERHLILRAKRVRAHLALMALDAAIVAGCLATMLLIRHGGAVPPRFWHGWLAFCPVATVFYVSIQYGAGLYGRMWRYAGIEEARRVILAGAAASAAMVALDLLVGRPVGLSIAAGAALLATLITGTVRFWARLFAFHRAHEVSGLRLIMLGAGDTGAALLRQLRETPGGITPVAVLDDDPDKRGRTCVGVRVAGSFADLPEIVRATDAHQALLAVPSAPGTLVRRMTALAEQADISLRVLPDPAERLDAPYRMRDARAVEIEDLLGRPPVGGDADDLAASLQGRVVLVTGGGGSIGSEMVRQVAHLGPREVLVLDHDETHLHDIVTEFSPRGSLAPVKPILVDVRDRDRIREIFADHLPDVVVHAAAHKHVPMLEQHPVEAALTNVLGTRNVVDAAAAIDVETLVMVSTDKAAHATSVMGASKWLAEQVVLSFAHAAERHWCAVRFGNVLGSRGSVVPLFTRQIASGGPVTVTDARMTRYFMTIPEAVQLVLRSAALSGVGDLFLLDMGEPIPILNLAKRMIRLAGYRVGEDIEIRIVGARPGEQLHERLVTGDESVEPTSHRSISRVVTRSPSPADLAGVLRQVVSACDHGDQQAARHALLGAVEKCRHFEPAHVTRSTTWNLSTTSET